MKRACARRAGRVRYSGRVKNVLLTLALAVSGAALAQTAPAAPATPAPVPTAPASKTPAATPAAAPAASVTASVVTPADPATAVASVGGETLTLGQFEEYYRQLVGRTVNAQGVPLTDDVLPSFEQYRPQILAQFARQRAVLQLAKAAGFKSDAAQLAKDLTEAKTGFATDAEFADALKSSGFAGPDAFSASLSEGQVYSAYLESIKSRFRFGDAVVASFYQINRASFQHGAQACAKHILVASQAEAQDIVKKLGAGSAFADLAKAQSKDPGSAAQGGDLGCLNPGETVAEFDKAAFSGPLNTPQVVKTEFGWHVLLVTSRAAAGATPLTEVASKIRDELSSQAAQKYLNAQVAKVKVETRPEVVAVQADPAAPAPAPASK